MAVSTFCIRDTLIFCAGRERCRAIWLEAQVDVGGPTIARSRRRPEAVYRQGLASGTDAKNVGGPAIARSRRPPEAVYRQGLAGGPDAKQMEILEKRIHKI